MTDHPHPKAALITGAGRRIGRALAEGLAREGVAVAVHFNTSSSDAAAVVATIRNAGGQAAAVQADLSRMGDVETLIGRAEAALGQPLDLLINNASVFVDDGIGDLDPARFQTHFDVHVRAPAFLSDAFARRLPDGREGLIVTIIDQRVWALTPRFFSYTLSKGAQWTMTQTLAQGLAPRIRVNAIGPGPTLANSRQGQEDFQKQLDALPLRRGPALDEFTRSVLYLWQARSVTGQMIALDGGQHLAWETPDVTGIRE